MVVLACWLLGPLEYLAIMLAAAWIAGSAGIWLFYVQHQFEDVYWECGDNWDYADAAIRGSSYFKLPRVLQYFTGNIGFHHVHHLSAKIPNYHLRAAHEEQEMFRQTPVVTIRSGIGALRLKLWDEERGSLVGFPARGARSPQAGRAQRSDPAPAVSGGAERTVSPGLRGISCCSRWASWRARGAPMRSTLSPERFPRLHRVAQRMPTGNL